MGQLALRAVAVQTQGVRTMTPETAKALDVIRAKAAAGLFPPPERTGRQDPEITQRIAVYYRLVRTVRQRRLAGAGSGPGRASRPLAVQEGL